MTATERYMQRTRNYNKGGEGASWGTPGAATPPARQQPQQADVQYQSAEEVMEEARDEAYHMDTTGLSTTNFAPPPKLFGGPANTNSSSARASPAPPPRVTGGYTKPAPSSFAPPPSGVPGAAATRAVPTPPPRLPARQNSNPDEFTPAPPPSYTAVVEEEPEVSQPPQQGRGVGPAAAQVNELQARFARMNPVDGGRGGEGDVVAQAATKKKPPPPPVKKVGLAATAAGQGQGQGGPGKGNGNGGAGGGSTPPPVPLGSRPKF